MLCIFGLFFLNLLLGDSIVAVILPQSDQTSSKNNDQEKEKDDTIYVNPENFKSVVIEPHKVDHNAKAPIVQENKPNVSVKNVTATTIHPPVISKTSNNGKHNFELDSDSIMRAVIVICVVAILFILFLGVKTFRNRNKRIPFVTKYGVRTKRNDLEMEPLQDDDDDNENEVIFEQRANQR